MCLGGSSQSTSTSQAANSTTVNVSTPINVDTSDLADAIAALSGAQLQAGELQLAGSVYQTQVQSATALAVAKSQGSGTSTWNVIFVVIALAGFLVTAHVIKVRL